jgi:hypothetical protein
MFRWICLFAILCSVLSAEDWPQWRGVNRDGKSGETGLLAAWPRGGPPAVWKAQGLGEGYSSVAVVGNRLCLYCDSWDGNLWIDHDPERPGLVVAAGDSGHGFKFAPALGKLIADIVERKPSPYAQRFAWRARGELAAEEARFTG